MGWLDFLTKWWLSTVNKWRERGKAEREKEMLPSAALSSKATQLESTEGFPSKLKISSPFAYFLVTESCYLPRQLTPT